MDLNTRLQNVAVVGAAGKMGSGISLLLALELTYRSLEQKDKTFILNLIDRDDAALQGLLGYLREQAVKDAERQMNRLRLLFADRPDLVENGEMIQEFVQELRLRLRTGKTLALAQASWMVFEAAFEKEEIKTAIYRELAAGCPPETYFFTNTSSIPLQALAAACGIQGRLIGFHFYNPPAVQKLLEVITPAPCDAELAALALETARVLGKKTVPASDVAGFIGNGHFMRDALQGLREMERLALDHGHLQAVHMVEMVTRDYLLRPMGLFQLMDYVGLDVCQLILRVMEQHLKEGLHSPLIDQLLAKGIRGGQLPGGAQRDGFFRYEKGRPVAILDPATLVYASLAEPWARQAEALLGPRPDPALTWKALQRDPQREARLRAHFASFLGQEGLGCGLAREHFQASRATALELVRRGVAQRPEDVNEVLMLGFFHLYGPVNDYL